MGKLDNKHVAILTESGFEEIELTSPKKALEEAGARVSILSPQSSVVKGWDKDHWSIEIKVDQQVSQADPNDFDALVLPGGVMNPDKLRLDEDAVAFAKEFIDSGKPVAAICHGPQLLIETNSLFDRRLTSYPSLKTDIENAGGKWEDSEVVVDNGLVTSRTPQDLEAFNRNC